MPAHWPIRSSRYSTPVRSSTARFYAATGDIVDFRFGEILNYTASSGITPSTWYIAAKSAWIVAGQDIVGSGTRPSLDPGNPAAGSTVFGNEPNETAAVIPPDTKGLPK